MRNLLYSIDPAVSAWVMLAVVVGNVVLWGWVIDTRLVLGFLGLVVTTAPLLVILSFNILRAVWPREVPPEQLLELAWLAGAFVVVGLAAMWAEWSTRREYKPKVKTFQAQLRQVQQRLAEAPTQRLPGFWR